jgi:hypothetical protein
VPAVVWDFYSRLAGRKNAVVLGISIDFDIVDLDFDHGSSIPA